MEKITLDKINIGNIVVARNGWTGYITEIEEVDNSFVSNLTEKTVEVTTKVLIGVRTDGEKAGLIFRCPAYDVQHTQLEERFRKLEFIKLMTIVKLLVQLKQIKQSKSFQKILLLTLKEFVNPLLIIMSIYIKKF